MSPLLCILPPYLLQHLAEHGDEPQRVAAAQTLSSDSLRRTQRSAVGAAKSAGPTSKPGSPLRKIADCNHSTNTKSAKVVRNEGDAKTGDAETDEAYDGLGATYELYWNAYQRNSIDGKGLELSGYVHYDKLYDNAFWDGAEMIFGDGDGTTFNRFTISVDVIGHELTHGVTQYESNLDYQGQSGALNESVSDCFGSLVKQYGLKQTAAEADWLIGAGLMKGKKDLALRSMKAPGTAYDDPELGKDPQPATMSGYLDTSDDDGGVHTNSGIPNHAFYLASVAVGGNAWEGAGKIWYTALTNGKLPASADFATFAQATIDAAGSANVKAVTDAWKKVEVID